MNLLKLTLTGLQAATKNEFAGRVLLDTNAPIETGMVTGINLLMHNEGIAHSRCLGHCVVREQSSGSRVVGDVGRLIR